MSARCLLALRLRLERDALALILRGHPLVSTTDHAATANALFTALRASPPDLVLLDHDLVDPALPALAQARARSDAPRFLVLAPSSSPDAALPWLVVGIDGYLPKSAQLDDLARAVRTVLRGRRYVHAPTADALLDRLTPDGLQLPSLDDLSQRERQVFDLIARGTETARIAEQLDLSVKTVSTYRSRMLQKLALRNNAQVTLFALRHVGGRRLGDGEPLVTGASVPDAEPST